MRSGQIVLIFNLFVALVLLIVPLDGGDVSHDTSVGLSNASVMV
jgi:hypothetical protein